MLQFKNDKALLAFAALLVVATALLVWHGDVTWKEGGAFIMGALALPGLFGKKEDDDKKDPPAGGATPLIVGAVLVCMLAGCTPQARAAFAELLAKKIACAVAHQDMPIEQMALVCALKPEDVPLAMQAVSEAREAGARQAVQAAARQRDLDEKVGVCRAEKP